MAVTPTKTRSIVFENAEGHSLHARLEVPLCSPRAFALFAHCFTCSKESSAATRISRALAHRGIAVLRFDFTGLGDSDGDFSETNFSSNVQDLVAAADFLRRNYQAPDLLVGHSFGGAAVLVAAPRVPEVKGVVSIAAPGHPRHAREVLEDVVGEIEERGVASVKLAGREFRIKKQFLEDLEAQRPALALEHFEGSVLILHSPRDEIVSIDNARVLFDSAHHPKSFVSLAGADHLLSSSQDAEYVAEVISAWSSNLIPSLPSQSRPQPEAGEVMVRERQPGLLNEIWTRGHYLLADEPVEVGGTNQGMNPYELLLAALGACTSMTLRLYADRKGIDLQEISVHLSHQRIHAEDCRQCETREGRVDAIQRRLEIGGDVSPEAKERLLQIADRCPVHRTLKGEIHIETKLEHRAAGPESREF